MPLTWNITKQRHVFARKDTYFVSVPKCGRTWLRVFLNAYFSHIYGSDTDVTSRDDYPDARPRYIFTHDRYENVVYENLYHRLRGKHLIPGRYRAKRRIILLVRDPRDIVVSLYFQLTERDHIFSGSLGEFVRNPRYGVPRIVTTINGWMDEWAERPDFMFLRYEDMRQDPATTFRRVLIALGHESVDDSAFQRALEYSSFDNMQSRERAAAPAIRELAAVDRSRPETYKARRGKIGGYVDYLTDEDIRYLSEHMNRLDPRLGY